LKLMQLREARRIVEDIKDKSGKSVDHGIIDALTEFIRVTHALGFETAQSCEGHIDWGNPFPWIDFRVTTDSVEIPSRWKFWYYLRRMRQAQEREWHLNNLEEKVDQFAAMLTHYLVQYDMVHGTKPEHVLYINRGHRFGFRLMPARKLLFQGCRISGDNQGLSQLLEGQRHVFKTFALFCSALIEKESDLTGFPEDGCRGCMGRG